MGNILGKNLKRIRLLRNMTQKELADRMGYTDRSTIAKIETGVIDPYISTVRKFAEVLNVTPMLLMGFYGDEIEEFLPYLAQADETTLNNIRAILGMPKA